MTAGPIDSALPVPTAHPGVEYDLEYNLFYSRYYFKDSNLDIIDVTVADFAVNIYIHTQTVYDCSNFEGHDSSSDPIKFN